MLPRCSSRQAGSTLWAGGMSWTQGTMTYSHLDQDDAYEATLKALLED
jgi:hypothetical protein